MDIDVLRSIYGSDRLLLNGELVRYEQAQQWFVDYFGPGPVTFFRTPGRLNLIGEHTDYNGGFVLPVALDRDILCVSRPRDDDLINAINVEDRFAPFSFALSSAIPHAPSGDWSNYFRGAAQEIARRFGDRVPVKGMDVLISGAMPYSIPRGAGLSSSTALSVTAALALVALNGIEIDRADLAHLCSVGEWYVGTRGGMMDQFATLLGERDHALFLDCRPSTEGVYAFEHVLMPGGVQVVLLTSGVHHDNVRGEFNQRVAECKIGVKLLQQRYPSIHQLRDVTPAGLRLSNEALDALLNRMLPPRATAGQLIRLGIDQTWLDALIADHRLAPDAVFAVLPRCRHVIGENARVLAGVAALNRGDLAEFGALMNRAHVSMSQDYGASCSEVDVLVDIVQQQPGVLGARITGAGWGGGVVALVEQDADEVWILVVQSAYRAATGLDTEVFVCRPGDGAGWLT
ncbi:MAG: galactokinase [Anaerolineae bacterium]|nr:galactokinase [Anaerolineae bacterium]